MELGFLENEKVDAAMWIGGPGSVGLQGVANALCGEVNPSGRLVGIPAADNFQVRTELSVILLIQEQNMKIAECSENTAPYKFMNYQEGIYVGYRYL